MTQKNQRLIFIELGVLSLLIIPFLAMFLTDEVNWTSSDFLIASVILLILGLLIEIVLRNVAANKNRVFIITAIIIVFMLIWAQLAVGLF